LTAEIRCRVRAYCIRFIQPSISLTSDGNRSPLGYLAHFAYFLFLFSFLFLMFNLNKNLCVDGPLPAGGTASSPSQSQTSLPGMINAEMNGSSSPSGSNKSRSHSTTSLYAQQLHPHPSGKRLMRDRKTVCSLHPLSSSGKEECCDLSDSELRAADRPSAENDSENEAQHCSTSGPGSAVDSRRGSGISTRYCIRFPISWLCSSKSFSIGAH